MWSRRPKPSVPPSRTTRSSLTSFVPARRVSARRRAASSRCCCGCGSRSPCRRSCCARRRGCWGRRWVTTASGRPGRSRSRGNGRDSRRTLRGWRAGWRRTRRSAVRTSRRRRTTISVSSASHPSAQGQGAGKALLEAFCRRSALDPLSAGVYLDTANPSSLEFYLRNGFVVRGEDDLEGTPLWCVFRSDAVGSHGGRHAEAKGATRG